MQCELWNVIYKCITGKVINRNDEAGLYNFLSGMYGEENILTALEINEDHIFYFGCAIREAGKWKVYNLAGPGVGVVVKLGRRYQLCRRMDNDK